MHTTSSSRRPGVRRTRGRFGADPHYDDLLAEGEAAKKPQLEESEIEQLRSELFQNGSAFEPTTRDQIVGIDNVLVEIDDVIHWLQHSKAYQRFGARLEPGIVFEGEPGTGKTLVSRYIAAESNALFVNVRDFPHNGSFLQDTDLSDMFQRARDTYASTKRPIILFWDEFEGGAKERSQVSAPEQAAAISQLTAELDGIHGKNEGVLLIGCTNYAYQIDAALLRPGRMGLHIEFNAPDREGKERLLAHYVGRIRTKGEINLETLSYFFDEEDTAAAIEEAVNESWRIAVMKKIKAAATDIMAIPTRSVSVSERDLIDVFLNRLIGPPPTFVNLVNDNLFAIAVHETGHALAALIWGIPLRLVTVRPGKRALGKTFTAKVNEYTGKVDEQYAQLRVGAGGLVAEDVTGIGRGIGSHGDTSALTQIASHLVDAQGMGKLNGLHNVNGLHDRQGLNNDLSGWLLEQKDRDTITELERAEIAVRLAFADIGGESIRAIAQLLADAQTMTGTEFTTATASVIGDPTRYAR